ncbi:MAG: S-layer homology domain-containing protein [Acutalibacter sp.]
MKRAKRWLAAALVAAMLSSVPVTVAAWENPFVDVPTGAWYYDAVEYVATQGLFAGTGEVTFSPDAPMTRAMFVTVLGKFAQVDPAAYREQTFQDVAPEAYYGPYVAWAAQEGLVSGIGSGNFAPHSTITREQMAVIFFHYAQSVGADTALNSSSTARFQDAGEISVWAKEAMAWAVSQGVLSGSAGKLNPKQNATRAQTAQILFNSRELLTTPTAPPTLAEEPAWIQQLQKELQGGTNTLASLEVTRQKVLGELSAHTGDSFYLGTAYQPGDWQSPNGDVSYNGRAGMNCGGFVSYVLRRCGLNASQAMSLIRRSSTNYFGSGKAYDVLAGASNYENLVKNGGLRAYVYGSKSNMLLDGKLEKGDVILLLKGPGSPASADNHMGIFWGDYPSEDLFWHSIDKPKSGNQISAITEASNTAYLVIKLD